MTMKIDHCSVVVWNQWSKQVAELQILQADAENQKKAGDNFYKIDEESIITIQWELSEDFYVLGDVKIDVVWRLLDGF